MSSNNQAIASCSPSPRWCEHAAAVREGNLAPSEVQFLMRCGPDWLDDPPPEIRDAIQMVRQYMKRQTVYYQELVGWLLFCAAGTQYLARTVNGGTDPTHDVSRILKIASEAISRLDQSFDIVKSLSPRSHEA